MATRGFAWLVATGVACVATLSLSASSSIAQLGVSVTVVRACVVDAQPGDASSSTLRLTCASGAGTSLRLSESIQVPTDTSGASVLRVPTVPVLSAASGSLQILTLNF